ncbi:MAG: nucleotidyl transferase AbiEii/AbiGii toxin family protein [Eggerthellaceae bacterium]|jgi:hypothetical protein
MNAVKRPNSRRNLDIAIERMAEEHADPLRIRAALAAAVVAQMIPSGVVKGGSALKLRFGSSQARFTRDLDAARTGDLDIFVEDLDAALREGWEGFTGHLVERSPAHPEGVEERYVMRPYDAKLSYNGKSWMTVPIEIGHNEIGDADEADMGIAPDICAMFEQLGFPAPEPAPLMPLHHQIAQKLHAASTPGSRRAHDLIDLQLIARNTGDLNYELLRTTCVRLFAYRKQQDWPPVVAEGERGAKRIESQAKASTYYQPWKKRSPGRMPSSRKSMQQSNRRPIHVRRFRPFAPASTAADRR